MRHRRERRRVDPARESDEDRTEIAKPIAEAPFPTIGRKVPAGEPNFHPSILRFAAVEAVRALLAFPLRLTPRIPSTDMARPLRSDSPLPPSRTLSAAGWIVVATLFLVPLAHWTASADAFRLPKRALASVALCAAAILVTASFARRRGSDDAARSRAALLFAAIVAPLLLATATSSYSALSWDLFLRALPFAAAVPLGLLLGREGRFDRRAENAILASGALTILVTLAQVSQVWNPVTFANPGEINRRGAVLAWVGDAGTLGLFLVIPTLIALHRAATGERKWALFAAVGFAAVSATATLTAVGAALVGAAVLLAPVLRDWFRSPAKRLGFAVAAVVLMVAAGATPTIRQRISEKADAISSGSLDRVLTRRLAGWTVASELIRRSPALGWGLGGFGAWYYPVRVDLLREDPTLRQRQTQNRSFGEVHNDPLQLVAETGVLGSLPLFALAGIVLVAAGRRRREDPLPFALLVTGLLASFFQFPFQVAVTALPLLLFAGRALRPAGEPVASPPPTRFGAAGAATLAVVVVVSAVVVRENARDLAASTKVAAAEAFATEAIRRGPETGAPLLRRALFLAESARLDAPRDLSPANAVAACLLLMGDGGGAERAYRVALSLERRAEFDLQLSKLLWARGAREEAVARLGDVLVFDETLVTGTDPEFVEATRRREAERRTGR